MKCGAEWSYQEVRRLAVLTTEEMEHFEKTMAALAAATYCEYKSVSACFIVQILCKFVFTTV